MKQLLSFSLFICLLTIVSASPVEARVINPTINSTKQLNKGAFMLGMRSTLSTFSHHSSTSLGIGGQFRLRFGQRINTEWFADYFKADIDGLGFRTDAHIGWSVMFNLLPQPNKWLIFLLAGHCFDYTSVQPFSTIGFDGATNRQKRWSSATQAGVGCSYILAPTVDVSLNAQYMLHLGKQIDTQVINNTLIVFPPAKGHLEGHLLFTASLNFYIAKLW